MSDTNKKGVIIIEGHIQGLSNLRSLAAYGIETWVIDKKECIAMHSKYCARFLKCPDFNSENFLDYLLDLAEKHEIKDWLLLPSNDHAAYSLSKHRATLLKYYKLITPELSIIDKIYDKVRLIELANKINIPTPKTYTTNGLSEDDLESIKYPVITKGRNGLSFYKRIRQKALLADNKSLLLEQLHFIKERLPIEETFTQELIPDNGMNKTVSFSCFSIEGEIKTYWMGEKLQEHPISFGTATVARSIKTPKLLNYSKRIIAELKYTGICEIEFLKDPRENLYKLIEINPRTWLWVGLANSCGINYAKIAYDYVNGIPINYPKDYPINIYWYNPYTYFFYGMLAIVKNKLSIRSFIRILISKKENALFSKGDQKPGIMYLLNIFRIYKNR